MPGHPPDEPTAFDPPPPDVSGWIRSERDRMVHTVAIAIGDLDLAAEAVDVALGKAWARWDALVSRGDPGAWIYRVAVNWSRRWFRRRRLFSDAPVPELGHEPEPALPSGDVEAALARLSPAHREVVALRLYADLDVATCARTLGVAEGTVRSRLSRALAQLRTDLDPPASTAPADDGVGRAPRPARPSVAPVRGAATRSPSDPQLEERP